MNRTNKKKQLANGPDIFSYHDYRKFLNDWFNHLKKGEKISLRSIARTSELSSAYLPSVLSGKRSLSSKALGKLAPHLHLKSDELEYLEALRVLSDSDSQFTRLEAFKKIQSFRSYRSANPKETEVYHYLEKWYYVVIREMANLKDFRNDPKWIASRLGNRITPGEAKEAVEFLTSHGYLELIEDGSVRLPQKQLECMGGVYRIALGQFHRQMLSVAQEVMENSSAEGERNVMGYTLPYSKNNLEKINSIISNAIDQIEKLDKENKDSDGVYHVTFLSVPVTVPIKEGDRNGNKN